MLLGTVAEPQVHLRAKAGMVFLIHSRIYRAGALCASIAALGETILALLLLAEVVTGHRSHAANVLISGFGVMLLLISFLTFYVGKACWKSSLKNNSL